MTPALVVRRTAVLLLPWWLRVGADGSREWTAAAGVAVPGGYEARAFDVLTDAADDCARYAALSAPAHACDAVAGAAGVTVPVTIDGADAWLRAEPGERVRVAARRFAEAHLAAGYKGGGCGSGDQSCVVDRLCEVLREKGGAPPPAGLGTGPLSTHAVLCRLDAAHTGMERSDRLAGGAVGLGNGCAPNSNRPRIGAVGWNKRC